ncbi:MAG: hypothetical protein KDN19_00305 [Verrucomicrobiae bacterium]|nr:hypothetical protein [Verrucomicrobiae bacterium]
MELPESSSIVLGLNPEGDPQRLSESTEGFTSYFGFDRERQRLVAIHRAGTESDLGRQRWRSINDRLKLARKLFHPSVCLILDTGLDTDDHLYFATEFVEGTPLTHYLAQFSSVPKNLGVHLVLQLAETAGYLADFPRLLATVSLDDFVVTMDRGRFLSLRLAHLGFDRDDAPVSDAVLGAHWIETVGHLLRLVIDGRPMPQLARLASDAAESGSELEGPLGTLISRLKSEPGSVAIRELKKLKATLLEAAGMAGENEIHRHPGFRAILDPQHRPLGSLSLLVQDSGEFDHLTQERWRPREDAFPVDDASLFSIQARAPRSPSANLSERGECVDLLLLPPERLIGGEMLPRLNGQMGDPFLKEHPYLVRTRSLVCDTDFTMVVAEGLNGFSLMNLVTARRRLRVIDSAAILEEIIRLLAHLDGIDLDTDRLDPWRLVFHFSDPLCDERLRKLVNSSPVSEWPPFTVKFRPTPTTESLIEPEAGSWLFLCQRFNGKRLPALLSWMMESERFDQALAESGAEALPLSRYEAIASLLEKAARHLDPADAGHRLRFLEIFRALAEEADKLPEPIPATDVEIDGDLSKRRRRHKWRAKRSLSAA